ncbi:MAG: hypothetical protein PHN63_02390 [Candidatus Omnitrophica bacterium]|nr:hypothetical protein [Candidatus Omnitrophota bacterium]
MKEKFEANVATEIPKTKMHEPSLPWKLTEDEVAQLGPQNDDLKTAMSGTPPLKTRAPFLILLIVAIFALTTYLVSNAVIENEKIRSNMAKKDSELSLAQLNMMKALAEKEAVNKNSSQLEKKISDLTAQKQLFASVIESLTKKGEDIDSVPVPAVPAAPDVLVVPGAQDAPAMTAPDGNIAEGAIQAPSN